MLAFQTSGGVEVKKYVIHFMEVAWYVTLSVCKLFYVQHASVRAGFFMHRLKLTLQLTWEILRVNSVCVFPRHFR